MKRYNLCMAMMLLCFIAVACGGIPNTVPGDASGDVSSREQAEIIAAALTAEQGGLGKDIENLAQPSAGQLRGASGLSLTVSAELNYYDADDQLQPAYDPQTTDRIDYESLIRGELSTGHHYFQQLIIDNRSDFMATERLSGTVIIDGTHSNHSSYVRRQALTDTEVRFNLACDMSAVGVAVDLHAADLFPEAGIIEGSITGSYDRTTPFSSITKTLNFHFTANYLGDHTAEIELNDGSVFSVHLGTGDVDQIY